MLQVFTYHLSLPVQAKGAVAKLCHVIIQNYCEIKHFLHPANGCVGAKHHCELTAASGEDKLHQSDPSFGRAYAPL